MDFESPDVEKDFPGLYASEAGRKSNESDFSDGGEHEKPSKKGLLGQRKDKKEKKDRGYAALEGESSPEEDTDTNPSKSKKTKSFKFPTKSKEKREKSRDKEKVLEEAVKQKELTEKEKKKEKEREKEREKEKKEKEKREKLREKDKEKEEKAKFKLESKEKLKDDKKDKTKEKDKEKVKEKDKEKVKEKEKEKVKEKDKEKVKEKDKDKKEKKLTKVPSTVTSGVPFEEIFTLGVALPIFGVPLHQSVERSRCHDDAGLPLIVRDSIDFLQANGLKSNQIYRTEPDKIKLQQLRKLYMDRSPAFPYHWDVPVAWTILKNFISELPDSILTCELQAQFEQATAMSEQARDAAVPALLGKLPAPNLSLLAWLMRHFEAVVANEQYNHVNINTIATAMGSALNMSLNLLTYFVTKADKLFPDVKLTKYVPPLPSIPADFPETAAELSAELRKQESLLSQIHAEMHAGFTSPASDHRLWEAQRIVTQLKRKLRTLQKSVEPNAPPSQQVSIDEKADDEPAALRKNSVQETTTAVVEEAKSADVTDSGELPKDEIKESPKLPEPTFPVEFEDNFENDAKFEVKFDKTEKFEAKFDENDKFEAKFDENEKFDAKFDENEKFDAKFDDESETFDAKFESKLEPFEAKFDAENEAFGVKFDDKVDFKFEDKSDFKFEDDLSEPKLEEIKDKPKFTEKELKVLRLQLENAEYLQLKSLLQAKINSEQFEIVKLRSYLALKNKQEGAQNSKEYKEMNPQEEQELKQRLMKENAMLEQKRLNLINQIFQERVACIHLKVELAMKEILSTS
ncbi:ralA-binding protein 1 isoform X2 [Aricia agestis]|uniref:ralA-binding protein 1 isoform X2 n=1 Tax=Aricia agestis TaxID=91739 RepID=UPI001C204CAB|nr:ralA-binding protein 1 isoform X2 [Aricia agestis]